MGGLWSRMPITGILWFSAALILSALPPASGFVGKWILFVGAFKAFHSSPLGLLIVLAAVLSTILTLVYTFLVGIRIFFGPLKPFALAHPPSDPSLSMSLPLLALAALSLVLGLYPQPLLAMFGKVIGVF